MRPGTRRRRAPPPNPTGSIGSIAMPRRIPTWPPNSSAAWPASCPPTGLRTRRKSSPRSTPRAKPSPRERPRRSPSTRWPRSCPNSSAALVEAVDLVAHRPYDLARQSILIGSCEHFALRKLERLNHFRVILHARVARGLRCQFLLHERVKNPPRRDLRLLSRSRHLPLQHTLHLVNRYLARVDFGGHLGSEICTARSACRKDHGQSQGDGQQNLSRSVLAVERRHHFRISGGHLDIERARSADGPSGSTKRLQ